MSDWLNKLHEAQSASSTLTHFADLQGSDLHFLRLLLFKPPDYGAPKKMRNEPNVSGTAVMTAATAKPAPKKIRLNRS